MARTTGKLGKLAPDHSRPALLLSAALKAAPSAPDTADYVSEVNGWPMYMNDKIGICTFAAVGHAIEGFTQYAKGMALVLPDAPLLQGYEKVGKYVPGDPSTDNGCVLQDVLDYWRKTGVGGDKIIAFAKVDPQNADEVAAAIFNFGHIIYGIEVPNSAMDQFNNEQPWDVVSNDGGIDGGHAVSVGSYKKNGNYECITWAAVQGVTPAFFKKYADEAWVVITQDWLNAAGNAPTGLDTEALNEAFTALTGEPGPFPAPTPTPTPPGPVPTPPGPPAPVPGPVTPDEADQAIAPVLEHLSTKRWVSNKSQDAMIEWLNAKGF